MHCASTADMNEKDSPAWPVFLIIINLAIFAETCSS